MRWLSLASVVLVSCVSACGSEHRPKATGDAGSAGVGASAPAGTSAGGTSVMPGASGEGGSGPSAAVEGGATSEGGATTQGGVPSRGGAPSECSNDAGCDDDEHCRAGTCRPLVRCHDDEECPSTAPHCDSRTFICEECTEHADCGAGGECTLGQVCVTHPTCSANQACPGGLVCDQLNRCVECVYSADCGGDGKCLAGRCADGCDGDGQCNAAQQCDEGFAACVDCLDDAGCPATHHCYYGRCELDTCEQHDKFCYADGIYECAENGATHVKASTCPVGCGLHDGVIGCSICEPNAMTCSQDRVVTCSADGGTWLTSQDCPQEDKYCQGGACLPRVCVPNEDSCVSRNIYGCNDNGSLLELKEDCHHGEVCDPITLECVPQLCEPNPLTSTCSGNLAVTCDETGLGYTAPPEDCGTKICSRGACLSSCTAVSAYEGLRLYEISAGKVVLKNISGCPLDIVGMSLEIWVSGATTAKSIWRLPSYSVPPQATLTVADTAGTGDVELVNFAAALNAAADKNIWLCIDPDGAAGNNTLSVCNDSNVFDIVEFGAAAPAFTGFSWQGLLEPDLAAGDFVARELYTGNEPTFSASDWSIHSAP